MASSERDSDNSRYRLAFMNAPEEVKIEADPTAVDGATDALALANHHHDADDDDDVHGDKKDDQPNASRRFFPR